MKLLSKAANLVAAQLESVVQATLSPQGNAVPRSSAPSDPVLEHLLRDYRSAKLRHHFFTAHDRTAYTLPVDVTLLVGTYNVAGKRPPKHLPLHDWLCQWDGSWPSDSGSSGSSVNSSSSNGASRPDIVAVGFQEVVPLSAGNVIAGPSADGADAWDAALAAALNGQAWAEENAGRTYGSVAAAAAAATAATSASRSSALVTPGGGGGPAAANNQLEAAAAVTDALETAWSGGGGCNSSAELGAASASTCAAAAAAVSSQQQGVFARALANRNDGDDVYIQIGCRQLVGVYLSVWVRKRIARHVRGVQSASTATGFGGMLANKGAVALRLRVYDTPLCIVCTHLASGDADGDEVRRNADAAEILRRCVFSPPAQPMQQQQQQQQQQGGGGLWGGLTAISDHSNVVWMGDLNYRLGCSDDEARRLLRSGRLESLLRHDQLRKEMAAGRVFVGWREGPITFAPTYKYLVGSTCYSGDVIPPAAAGGAGAAAAAGAAGSGVPVVSSSTSIASSDAASSAAAASGCDESVRGGVSSSVNDSVSGGESAGPEKQKRRTPAWCDRVLWMPGLLHQLAYGRAELMVSDHRPVAAAFLLRAHRYDRDEVKALAETSRRAVDSDDNALRPRVSLTPNFWELGQLPFGCARSASLTLSNTGTVPARFYFVAPPTPRLDADGTLTWDEDQPLAPSWLNVWPLEGQLLPGCSTSIQLTARVTSSICCASSTTTTAASAAKAVAVEEEGGGGAGGGGSAAAASSPLPLAPAALDTILVLRVEDGADAFISCRGTALPSCFGADLDALLQVGSSPLLPLPSLAPEALCIADAALLRGNSGSGALPAPDQAGRHSSSSTSLTGGDGVAGLSIGNSSSSSSSTEQQAVLGGGVSLPLVTGVEARVPKEVQRLVAFLADQQRLYTPGVFVESLRIVTGRLAQQQQQQEEAETVEKLTGSVQEQTTTAAAGAAAAAAAAAGAATVAAAAGAAPLPPGFPQQALLDATAPVRWALDSCQPLPSCVDAHAAAAALLLLLQQLPDCIIPADVDAALQHCVPPHTTCRALLSDALSVAEWATLRHVLALLRAALAPAAAACNGLNCLMLAQALERLWFGGPAPAELQANRLAFLMLLLDVDETRPATVGPAVAKQQ